MKVTNFSTKPVFQILFFGFLILALINVGIIFTNIAPFDDVIHLSLGALFVIIALVIFVQNIFVQYDSRDELIEIEQASLFSPKQKVRSMQQGYVKSRVRSYEIRKVLFFKQIILIYEKSNGEEERYVIPVTYFSKRKLKRIVKDLKEIMNNNSQMFIGANFKNPYIS